MEEAVPAKKAPGIELELQGQVQDLVPDGLFFLEFKIALQVGQHDMELLFLDQPGDIAQDPLIPLLKGHLQEQGPGFPQAEAGDLRRVPDPLKIVDLGAGRDPGQGQAGFLCLLPADGLCLCKGRGPPLQKALHGHLLRVEMGGGHDVVRALLLFLF